MPKIIDLVSTAFRRSTRLDNEPPKIYCLFDKLSLAGAGTYEASKLPTYL